MRRLDTLNITRGFPLRVHQNVFCCSIVLLYLKKKLSINSLKFISYHVRNQETVAKNFIYIATLGSFTTYVFQYIFLNDTFRRLDAY